MDDKRGLTASSKQDRGRAARRADERESPGRPKVVPPETLPDIVPPPKEHGMRPLPRLTTFPPA